MSGGSSSSSSSNTTQQTDKRIAADSSLVISDGSTATISVEDISADALDALTQFGAEVLGFAETAQTESYRVSEAALQRAFASTPGGELLTVEALVKWGLVVGGAAASARYAPDIIKALKG